MTSPTPSPLTRAQLCIMFSEVGLSRGDSVLVHSACSTLGPVDGGADTVLDALLEVIGAEGNLMLPTFNYTRPLPEPYFDPTETAGLTGVLAELGRKRPGAVRSLHPAHSVAVIGPDADALTRDHHTLQSFGVGSPIDRLAQTGGKVLLVGVGHVSNSTIHVAEEHAGIPKTFWCDPPPWVKVRTLTGQMLSVQLDSSASCSAAFGAAEGILRKYGEIRDLRQGNCKLQLMSGKAVLQRVAALLQEKPDHLLCTWAGCKPCVGARAALQSMGLI